MTEVLVKISKRSIRLKKGDKVERIPRHEYTSYTLFDATVCVSKDTVTVGDRHMPNQSTGKKYIQVPSCPNLGAVIFTVAVLAIFVLCVVGWSLALFASEHHWSPNHAYNMLHINGEYISFYPVDIYMLWHKSSIFPCIHVSLIQRHTFTLAISNDGVVSAQDYILFQFGLLANRPAPQNNTIAPGPVGPKGIGPCPTGHEGIPGPPPEFHSPNGVYGVKVEDHGDHVKITLTNVKTGRLISTRVTDPLHINLRVTNQGSFGIPGQKPILSFSQRIRRLQSPDGFHIVVFNEESCTMTFPNSRQRKFADVPCQLIMQEDRNLVVYNRAGEPLWASDTANHEEELALEVLDDGRLCLVNEKKECVRWVVESKI